MFFSDAKLLWQYIVDTISQQISPFLSKLPGFEVLTQQVKKAFRYLGESSSQKYCGMHKSLTLKTNLMSNAQNIYAIVYGLGQSGNYYE